MFDTLLLAVLAIIAAAALLTLRRLVRGPTLPDRVVAIDLIGVLVVASAVVSAARTGSSFFLDVAVVIALISFVGTVAYARFVETADLP